MRDKTPAHSQPHHRSGPKVALGFVLPSRGNLVELAFDPDSSDGPGLHHPARIDAPAADEPLRPILAGGQRRLPGLRICRMLAQATFITVEIRNCRDHASSTTAHRGFRIQNHGLPICISGDPGRCHALSPTGESERRLAVHFSATRNPGDGKDFTDLAAAVQLRLRVRGPCERPLRVAIFDGEVPALRVRLHDRFEPTSPLLRKSPPHSSRPPPLPPWAAGRIGWR